MKRRFAFVIFATTTFAAVAACHLLLDPDTLVSGEGQPDADPTGEGGTPDGDLPSNIFDASSEIPEWKGQVPGCIPTPPPGVTVFGVVGGPPGTVPACPAGYESTTGPAGFGGVIDTAMNCANGTCSCGPLSSNSCTNIQLRYSNDPQCNSNIGTDNLDFGCARVGQTGATHAMVTGRLGSQIGQQPSCPAAGDASTALQTPRFGLEVHLCKPQAGAPTPSCPGSLAMPPTKDAVACYQGTSAQCPAPFKLATSFTTDKTMVDTRSCGCRCQSVIDGGCAGGSVRVYDNNDCDTLVTEIDAGCRPIADYGPGVRIKDQPTPIPGAAKCNVETSKNGNVQPQPQLFLCCIPRCDACKLASVAPGGTCKSFVDTCTNDSGCNTYRTCITQNCGGGECAQCQVIGGDGGPDSGGVPVPQTTLNTFRAIATCQTNACPPPDCP